MCSGAGLFGRSTCVGPTHRRITRETGYCGADISSVGVETAPLEVHRREASGSLHRLGFRGTSRNRRALLFAVRSRMSLCIHKYTNQDGNQIQDLRRAKVIFFVPGRGTRPREFRSDIFDNFDDFRGGQKGGDKVGILRPSPTWPACRVINEKGRDRQSARLISRSVAASGICL